MEQINQILGNNLLFIIAVLLVLIVFLLVMLVNMNSKLRKLQWKYDYFTKGTTMDLDEVLTQTLEDVRSAEAKITALEKSRDDLRLRLKSCVQNLRVLRYNAFDNTGSDLSYSVALVDEEKRIAGVYDDLVRISVGIEDVEDLIEDFTQAIVYSTTAPL